MSRFLQAGLFLSSLLLMVSSCSPLRGYRKEKNIPDARDVIRPVIPDSAAQLYRSEIDVLNKHFSGLLMIKKMNDSIAHLTFVTELGMTVFDFRIVDQEMQLVSIMEPLNKKSLVSLLREDLSRMFLLDLFRAESELFTRKNNTALKQHNKYKNYYFAGDDHKIDKILIRGIFFRKARIFYQYSDIQDHPTGIKLKRSGAINLRINLKSIAKE